MSAYSTMMLLQCLRKLMSTISSCHKKHVRGFEWANGGLQRFEAGIRNRGRRQTPAPVRIVRSVHLQVVAAQIAVKTWAQSVDYGWVNLQRYVLS